MGKSSGQQAAAAGAGALAAATVCWAVTLQQHQQHQPLTDSAHQLAIRVGKGGTSGLQQWVTKQSTG